MSAQLLSLPLPHLAAAVERIAAETGTDVLAAGRAEHLAALSFLAEQLRREIRGIAARAMAALSMPGKLAEADVEVAAALMNLVHTLDRLATRIERCVAQAGASLAWDAGQQEPSCSGGPGLEGSVSPGPPR